MFIDERAPILSVFKSERLLHSQLHFTYTVLSEVVFKMKPLLTVRGRGQACRNTRFCKDYRKMRWWGESQWLLRKNHCQTVCAETVSADVSRLASFLWGIRVSLKKHLSGRVSSRCVILIMTWVTFRFKMLFWFTHWRKYLKANQTFFLILPRFSAPVTSNPNSLAAPVQR